MLWEGPPNGRKVGAIELVRPGFILLGVLIEDVPGRAPEGVSVEF